MSDDADEVAIEHVLWAAGEGASPAAIMASVGIDWPREVRAEATDAVKAVAAMWLRISTSHPHGGAFTPREADGNKRTKAHEKHVTRRDGRSAKLLESKTSSPGGAAATSA